MDFTRQRDLFDPDKTRASVTHVGCGGVGSFAALALAKLGVHDMKLIDPDTVEEHNVPNQLFKHRLSFDSNLSQVGVPKVTALRDLIAEFADPEVITVTQSRLEDTPPEFFNSDVVVSGLDSMEARSALWERLRWKIAPRLLLDARLAGQMVVLYAVRPMLPSDVEAYEKTLYSDEEALEVSCTSRGVIDVGFFVAALITRNVRAYYANETVASQTFLNVETLDIMKGGWS